VRGDYEPRGGGVRGRNVSSGFERPTKKLRENFYCRVMRRKKQGAVQSPPCRKHVGGTGGFLHLKESFKSRLRADVYERQRNLLCERSTRNTQWRGSLRN